MTYKELKTAEPRGLVEVIRSLTDKLPKLAKLFQSQWVLIEFLVGYLGPFGFHFHDELEHRFSELMQIDMIPIYA